MTKTEAAPNEHWTVELARFCQQRPGTIEARAARAVLINRRSLAYGAACREPWKCVNKGYCPRDPTCAD